MAHDTHTHTFAKILLITIARVLINRIRRDRATLCTAPPDVNRTRVERALYLLYWKKKQSEDYDPLSARQSLYAIARLISETLTNSTTNNSIRPIYIFLQCFFNH